MTVIPFSKFVIELESLTTPGTFIRPCGLTSKGLDRSYTAVESTVPSCTDESMPAEIQRGIASADWSLSGSATIKAEDLDDWEARADGGLTFNVRITVALPSAQGGRVYTAPAVITKFGMKTDLGAKAATGDITIDGAGRLTHVPCGA